MSRPSGSRVARRVGFVAAFACIILVLLLVSTVLSRHHELFSSPLLSIGTGVAFRFGMSSLVAVMTFRGYLRSRSTGLLLLGCGALAFALSGILGNLAINAFQNTDFSVAISNSGALLSGVLHAVGASLALFSSRKAEASGRPATVLTAYATILTVIVAIAGLLFAGILPSFVTSAGPTPLDENVLLFTFVLFSFSSVAVLGTYTWSRSAFLYWYALALALIAASQLMFLVSADPNDLVAWSGETLTAAGSLYMLAAVITGGRSISLVEQ